MTVWVLIAQSIYDHGVVGVFSSEDRALARAVEVHMMGDGFHSYRVEPLDVDGVYAPQHCLRLSTLAGPLPLPTIDLNIRRRLA